MIYPPSLSLSQMLEESYRIITNGSTSACCSTMAVPEHAVTKGETWIVASKLDACAFPLSRRGERQRRIVEAKGQKKFHIWANEIWSDGWSRKTRCNIIRL
jgi:hypothetical protein